MVGIIIDNIDASGRTQTLKATLNSTKRCEAYGHLGDCAAEGESSTNGRECIAHIVHARHTQRDNAKRRLIERFREGDSQGRPGCVLVASASFWEGVDVPGDALQLVIIDKLPFPPPGDPLVEARAQRLERQGRSAFNDYFVPEAAVALKQGAGRLIRRESDQGLLVVCDTRLLSMGYGRRLLAALPPMRRLQSAAEFNEAIEALASGAATGTVTTPSTTAPGWT